MINRLTFAGVAAGFIALPAAAQDTPDALAAAFCAAVAAEDKAALGALYTEDADSYGPDGSVIAGRAAIAESWGSFFDAFDELSCALNEAGHIKSRKNATVWGLWTITGTPAEGGDMVEMNGRYMDVVVKTKDGWRYRADHVSMSAATNEAGE